MVNLNLDIKRLFTKKNYTLSVAESSSGGLLSHLVTNIPGSSQYFILGVIAYSNAAKTSILKIPRKIIFKNGAVSSKVARLMASSVKKLAKSDFGIGITGIAGPGGGSKSKPVGTVFIAIDGPAKKICQRFSFKGSRLAIKKAAAQTALRLLKDACR